MFDIKDMAEELKALARKQHFFSVYRLVDPDTHVVYDYAGGRLVPQKAKCYDYWGFDLPCVNCTSKRALTQGGRIIKLEYAHEHVTMVHSLPIVLCGHRCVLELADDVTDSFMLHLPTYDDNSDVGSLIRSFNDLMIRDSFTGLFNKNYIMQELSSMLRLATEGTHVLSAAILDIDRFKAVNDTFGHLVGDDVLRATADYIKALMGDPGIFGARFGGDEFFILFENIGLAESGALCAALSDQIASHIFLGSGGPFAVRISYGVGDYVPGESGMDFIQRLDASMYEMKRERYGGK